MFLLIAAGAVTDCRGGGGGGDGDDDDDDVVDGPPLTVDEAVRAGVVWGSCVPDDGIADIIQEYWSSGSDRRLRHDVFRCLATHGDGCDAVSACAGVTVDLGGPCEQSCSGSTFADCDDQLRFRMDCASAGLRCDPARGCVDGPAGASCDWDTYEQTCEGGRVLYCGGDGVEEGPVCADYGLECGVWSEWQGALCVGTGGACDPDPLETDWIDGGGSSCSGDVLESCVYGSRAVKDCAAAGPGFSCQTAVEQEGEVVAFCGLGSECVPDLIYRGEATCDGTVVTFCNVGRLESFDCRDLGFTGCAPPLGCTPTGFSP